MPDAQRHRRGASRATPHTSSVKAKGYKDKTVTVDGTMDT